MQQVNRRQYLIQSGNNEWYTPPWVAAVVRHTFGGVIDFDPFSCDVANSFVGASVYYTKHDDALVRDWPTSGTLYANPPYERKLIDACVDKCVQHYVAYPNVSQCVLVNVCSETKWFQQLLNASTIACLFHKRIRFIDSQGLQSKGNTRSQIMFLLGEQHKLSFYNAFSSFGTMITTQKEIQ